MRFPVTDIIGDTMHKNVLSYGGQLIGCGCMEVKHPVISKKSGREATNGAQL